MFNRIILLTLTLLYIVLCILSIKIKRRKQNTVVLPSVLVWVGVIGSGIFLLFAWLAEQDEGSLGLTLAFCMFALVGMTLMIGWLNCRIVYDEDGFTQKTFIGRKHRYSYSELTGWSTDRGDSLNFYLHIGDKKISFSMMTGYPFFFSVTDGYRRTHGNQPMPEVPWLPKEKKGFRGHVYKPERFLAVFLMLLTFILGAIVWIAATGLQPIDEEDGAKYTMTFASWSVDGDNLLLHSSQESAPFILRSYDSYVSNIEGLKAGCDGKNDFTLWVEYKEPKNKDPYYDILALSSEEEVYRSFEDTTAQERKAACGFLMILGIMLLFFLSFSFLTYLVGRNPEKFPKKMVYAFFRESEIDI